MKRSPYPEWPDVATVQTALSTLLPDGGVQCAASRPVCFDAMVATKTWTQFMRELKRRDRDGHYATARLLYGCVGRSRDVSREHPLNEGETLV